MIQHGGFVLACEIDGRIGSEVDVGNASRDLASS